MAPVRGARVRRTYHDCRIKGVVAEYSADIAAVSFYRPAPGARPPYLSGRSAHTTIVASALSEGALLKGLPVLFSGRILTGRTAVLTETADMARRAGWETISVSVVKGADLNHRIATAAGAMGEQSATELISRLCDLPDTKGVAVFFDDIDLATDASFAVFTELSDLMATGRRLIVVATCIPSWAHRLLESPGAQPKATYMSTGLLETPDIVAAVVIPARQHGVNFTRKAVDAIVNRCHGVPALVQMLAHHAASSAIDNTVTEAVVLSTIKDAERDVIATFFSAYYDPLNTSQQRFLRALRQEGDGSGFEAVRRRIGDFSRLGPSPLRQTCDELLETGLLYTNDGERLHFSVAAFSAYVGTVD